MKIEQEKRKNHIPLRINLLFLSVFLLFSVLVIRLGVVQIVFGEDYKKELERTEDITVSSPVPRGKIYDRNGKNIVNNTSRKAITYTKYGVSQKEMLKTAERLALLIDMKPKKLQEWDLKDYWLIKNPGRGEKKVTEKERIALKKELDEKEYSKKIYSLKIDHVTNEELKELTKQDLENLAIYVAFNSGYALTPQIVKNEGVTDEEFALVSENLQYLPGVDTTTDWDRKYSFGNTLKTVLGRVTKSSEGIPKEQLDYYLARGYNRNDRVGTSYIEAEYEDLLHGQKEKVKNVTDKAGNVLSTSVISEGQSGKDLVLTVDMDLQLAVEKIIEEELLRAKSQANTGLLDRAFVVLMDPNTGEVLTMAGKQIVRDEETGRTKMQDFALGTITTSYNVGSSVKGATVLTGLKEGAITTHTTFLDRPIKIKGTPEKGSYNRLGTLDPVGALRLSSNVYMFETVIRIANGHYEYNQPLPIDIKAFDTIRDDFAQFGLGTRTGIDLPNEQIGYKGTETIPGKLMDLAIGQYDTYTPMQMAQYVSTIANGGYRIQPHLVKEIHEANMDNGELGPIFKEIEPRVLNKIELKDEWLQTVQKGFRQVMESGTAARKFSGAYYMPAGKTGTAEAFYDGPERKKFALPPQVMNLSLVAYAPYARPEVAMSVVVPWAYQAKNGHTANYEIGERVLRTYFDLKKQRNGEELNQPVSSQP